MNVALRNNIRRYDVELAVPRDGEERKQMKGSDKSENEERTLVSDNE